MKPKFKIGDIVKVIPPIGSMKSKSNWIGKIVGISIDTPNLYNNSDNTLYSIYFAPKYWSKNGGDGHHGFYGYYLAGYDGIQKSNKTSGHYNIRGYNLQLEPIQLELF